MDAIRQFGNPFGEFRDRPGAYGVILDRDGKLLVVVAKARYHLPGGGIDEGEDPETALRREIREETGYSVGALQFLGRANQFLETKDLGPINKLGTYFLGHEAVASRHDSGEEDHVVQWIDPQDFLTSTAHEFHRWAVTRALEECALKL